MQVLHRQPASRIYIRRALHPVLAVQQGKHQLPPVLSGTAPHSVLQLLRHLPVKAVHDAEYLLRRPLIVRHLSVSVPGRNSVRRNIRPATHVLIPICRAFSTMFPRPRRRSNSLCARFARRGTIRPSLFRIRNSRSARNAPVPPAWRSPAGDSSPGHCPGRCSRSSSSSCPSKANPTHSLRSLQLRALEPRASVSANSHPGSAWLPRPALLALHNTPENRRITPLGSLSRTQRHSPLHRYPLLQAVIGVGVTRARRQCRCTCF